MKSRSFLIKLATIAATLTAAQAASISVTTSTTVNFTSAGTGPTGAFATDYIWNAGTSTFTSPNDGRSVEGTTLTFNIDPGVTVAGGRYFIGTVDNAINPISAGPAIWNINGGGTVNITRTGIFNLRLGQNGGTPAVSEAGLIVISGGSALRMSEGAMQEQAGSLITLNGLGSSFTASGALTGTVWDPTNLRFTGTQTSTTTGVLNNGSIDFAFSGTGVTGISAVNNSGLWTMTAIPEPSSALIGGLGMLALLRRRRA